MTLNPNYPLIETAWGPYWDCNGGEVPPDRYVDLGGRTLGTFSAQRGRQAELDQVQAGTMTLPLSNTDGALDPGNTAGPWAGRILPFQPVRRRAQWPPTVNLLTPVQATGGDAGGYLLGALSTADDGPRILTETDPAGGTLLASGTAWQGGTVIAMTVPAGAAAGAWVCCTGQPAVRPGRTYTVQMQVRNTTPGTSVQVAAGFRTLTVADAAATTAAGSTATLVGSATAAWTQVTVTATAAADSSGMWVGVQLAAVPGAACTIEVDGWQLEAAAAASAWVTPGTWYPISSQFTEDWPAAWTAGGTYGTITPGGVDALALLSQFTLDDPLTAEIKSHQPRFLYRLDDPAGSTAAADATGTNQPAPVKAGKYGPGVVTFGTEVTAADPAGVFTGAPGPVVNVTNASPGTNIVDAASYIDLAAVGIKGPADPAGDWTRIIAFRWTGPARGGARTQGAVMWSCFDGQRPQIGTRIEMIVDFDGEFKIIVCDANPANLGVMHNLHLPVDDGNWHLAQFVHDTSVPQYVIRIDETINFYPEGGPLIFTGIKSDSLGNYVDGTNGGGTAFNWAGDIAFAAEFPVAFTTTDMANMYDAWRAACAGESTDARYARILRYAGYSGPTSIQTGLTTSMGAADFAGQDAVTALQAVVDTEGGAHFVDGAGGMNFRSRAARYNAVTPQVVFGERTDLGEFPYEDCQPTFDSTHLGNVAAVTQTSTGQVFTSTDKTSMDAYFRRTLTRSVNSASALECQDAAAYLVSRYRQPVTRITTLRLHPSAHPALWPVCLTLEQGARVRVMRRPFGAPPIQLEQFVEALNWTMDDKGDAVLVVQTSPVDTTPYAVFTAWHTTLATAAAAGAASITVSASADTTNPLAAQLGPGQQLVLGLGTAGAETVTVQAVGATSPGWTTAVITLTAPTTAAHAAGDTVCEPLPAGITDPTTYDAVARFDQVAFAY